MIGLNVENLLSLPGAVSTRPSGAPILAAAATATVTSGVGGVSAALLGGADSDGESEASAEDQVSCLATCRVTCYAGYSCQRIVSLSVESI